MAKIDRDGIVELNKKIKNTLEHMYDKLEKRSMFNDFSDEFDFIYRFLESIETNWEITESGGASSPKVIVNGQEYKPRGG